MIDPAFWKKVKMTALERDMNVSEFVEKGLTKYMESSEAEKHSASEISDEEIVEEARGILKHLRERDFIVKGLDVELTKKKGIRKDRATYATQLSKAMTDFTKALNLNSRAIERDRPSQIVDQHNVIYMANVLIQVYDQGITSNAITDGLGLTSKVEKLKEENERLLKENERLLKEMERLLKENEQLRSSLQNVSAAYEEFSAKNR